jgi:peptide/nickel transport system permease protein
MAVTKYVLRRIAYLILVFFIVSFLMYCLYNLVPEDPARNQLEAQKKSLKPDVYQRMYLELREEMGLDDSLVIRYARWMGLAPQKQSGKLDGLLEGNLGKSNYFKKDVIEVVQGPIGNTVFINIFSTILALGITIPLGIYCAVHKGGKVDSFTQVFTIIGYSIPIYITALVFIYIFAVLLGWFPVSGMGTPGAEYTGMKAFWDKLYYISLPLIVMTFASLGGMTRYVRAAMIDALSMDHIKTARAKGVKEKVVIYSHAWRNALLPVITLIIGWFLGIFSGSVLIENTFNLNGMGKLYITALNNHDWVLTLGIQMFYTVVSLVGALIIDLSYGLVDPRVRIDK